MAAIHRRIMENWGASDWSVYGSKMSSGIVLYNLLDEKGKVIVTDTLLNLDIRGKEL